MKDLRSLILSTLVLFVLFQPPLQAQISSKQIDRLVEDAMEKFSVAGVAVGVVKDGEIIHAKGYGVKSVETGDKVDEQTSFAIASNSKAFTTAAVAILVEEGPGDRSYPGV
jgi:CubicO group peptidase (beta-lactamase class C family)